jgi:hypothetical protein
MPWNMGYKNSYKLTGTGQKIVFNGGGWHHQSLTFRFCYQKGGAATDIFVLKAQLRMSRDC